MSEMIKITGLWKGKDKNGSTFMSGTMGGVKVLIFANKYKEEDKHPDYIMYFAQKEDKKDGGSGSASGSLERATYKPEDDDL